MTVVPTGVRGEESSLVARLTLEQKVHLLTGADSWALHGESAVGLRQLITSDGPAGVRGTRFDPSNPSTSLPCPVALAATWDVGLVEEIATALGQEARTKGVDVLLAPTMNIIRTPLSGRGFECFSEDPLLTSRIAVAYVRGVQRAGVGATAKHYVANDSETDRRSYVARISEGVLRELYLPPFEACVGEAGVLACHGGLQRGQRPDHDGERDSSARRSQVRLGVQRRGDLRLVRHDDDRAERAGRARPRDAWARRALGRQARRGGSQRRRPRGRDRRQGLAHLLPGAPRSAASTEAWLRRRQSWSTLACWPESHREPLSCWATGGACCR